MRTDHLTSRLIVPLRAGRERTNMRISPYFLVGSVSRQRSNVHRMVIR
jgi:hypothetical protein